MHERIHAYHAGTPDLLFRAGDAWTARLKLRSPERPTSAWIRGEPDHEEALAPLRRIRADGPWSVWEGEIPLDPCGPVTRYAFKLVYADRQAWLSQAGLHDAAPERDLHFRLVPGYEPASWVPDQVFYQIFPDRFRNGDPSNDPRSGAYLYDGRPIVAKGWDELPEPASGAREFFGGDLRGVTEGLDHLERLGATAIYLNPVFESPSSHKYDTTSYDRVDPAFGGNEALAELRAATRARGMRLVLDAVVNHTGERHPWFDRYGEHARAGGPPGAYGDPASPYRGRYVFRDPLDPESYAGWYGVRTLPVLDWSDPGLREDVVEGEDAILRRWMREPYAIDGWRFDVVHMLGEGEGATNNAEHVRSFRRALREERPDAYVLGEHFFEATDWLQGDQEDGSMNYWGFQAPLIGFLAGIDHRAHPLRMDAAELERQWTRARARLPFPIQLQQYNLLGSHDTPRILTRVGGDRARAIVAAAALLTYIGVPGVYYGDEVGLEGGADPDCRRPMPWDESRWDLALFDAYRALVQLRRAEPALRRGGYAPLHAEGDALAFARALGGDVLVTAFTRGGSLELDLPVAAAGVEAGAFEIAFSSAGDAGGRIAAAGGRLRLRLEPGGARVLKLVRPSAP